MADAASEEGPDDGHTWRFTAECRGSYAVVGEPHHDVRAWSLSAALEKASRLPFPILMSSLWED